MYLNICILTSLVAQSIGLLIGAAMSVEVMSVIDKVYHTILPIFLQQFRTILLHTLKKNAHGQFLVFF